MEKGPFLKQHSVLIKCAVVSFAAHLVYLFAFQVAVIRQKPLPSHLQFTLLSVPELWDSPAGPLTEATNDLHRAETSLLALFESTAASTHPKLELLHKQLIWEQEPESMTAAPPSSGVQDWSLRKEEADYSLLFGFLNDNPPSLESAGVEDSGGPITGRRSRPRKTGEIAMSPSLTERRIIDREVPPTPKGEIASSHARSTRLSVAIDSSGAVRHVLVLRSSGDPALDTATRKAVSKWRFAPAVGTPAPTLLWGWVELPFPHSPVEPAAEVPGDAAAQKSEN